jgi:putative phosphoribosyl transferase
MRFSSRSEAAEQLAERLEPHAAARPLVLGVPRGAVPMARIIADRLGGDLDVVLVHKLRAPHQPELAIGALDESGHVSLAEWADEANATAEYLDAERRTQARSLAARRARYTPVRAPVDPAGRVVIIVDDGIATGFTMTAAIGALRTRGPARIIVATPVAPPDTLEKLAQHADEVVCLHVAPEFYAVAQFYEHFPQVSDDEVVAALRAQ